MKVRLYELFPRCLYLHFFHNTKYLGLIHFFIVRQPLFFFFLLTQKKPPGIEWNTTTREENSMPALHIDQFSPVSLLCFLFFVFVIVTVPVIKYRTRARRLALTVKKALTGFFRRKGGSP